jgi:hypothetical protein
MIQLKADCLLFQTTDGEQVPCSAEWVTLELMGEGAAMVDPEVVRHASAAVLHYFKNELKRPYVSVSEFAIALEKVLRSFGLSVYADFEPEAEVPKEKEKEKRIVEFNLHHLANSVAADGFELLFFPQLRQELQRQMQQSPEVVRFLGLRDCVKQLAGTERWNRRCDNLNDQIVDFLRSCWQTESASQSCALVVL